MVPPKLFRSYKRRSITGRWIAGSLLMTIIVVAIGTAGILFAVRQSYYQSALQLVEYQLRLVLSEVLSEDISTSTERYNAAFDAIEGFVDKGRFELMLLNSDGRVIATSSGFEYPETEPPEDFLLALDSQSINADICYSPTGEHLAAASSSLDKPAGVIAAVRVVSSIEGVDRQLFMATQWAILFSIVIISFSVLTGLYFVRSIVRPIQRIEESAKLIASGNFSVRVHNPINDEIGELCEIINEMAVGLGAAEQIKNEFVSSVSHELRTPLTSIRGWTDTLLAADPGENPEMYKKGLSIIANETSRLYDMVEDLLDFSRMAGGELKLNRKNMDIVAEIEDAVLIAEQRAAALSVQLKFDPPEEPMPVLADPDRMRQVFVNLLDNAIKYSVPGGVVDVTARAMDGRTYISVTDHGTGIPSEDLPNITQKFFKAGNSVGGSGIGLAIVKEIMQAHGGSIDIKSSLGKGTTVTVELPAASSREGKNER